MRSNLGCFMSMLLIFGLSISIEKIVLYYKIIIPQVALALVLLVLVGFVFLYAPSATLNHPITKYKEAQKKKLYSVILSGVFSLIIWYVPSNVKVLLLAPFICEVITILPIVNYRVIREEGRGWKRIKPEQK